MEVRNRKMMKHYSASDAQKETLEIIHHAGYTPYEVDADAYFKALFQVNFSLGRQYWVKRQEVPAPEDFFYQQPRQAVTMEKLTADAEEYIKQMSTVPGWEESVDAEDIAEGLYWAGETFESASSELVQFLYMGEG